MISRSRTLPPSLGFPPSPGLVVQHPPGETQESQESDSNMQQEQTTVISGSLVLVAIVMTTTLQSY